MSVCAVHFHVNIVPPLHKIICSAYTTVLSSYGTVLVTIEGQHYTNFMAAALAPCQLPDQVQGAGINLKAICGPGPAYLRERRTRTAYGLKG